MSFGRVATYPARYLEIAGEFQAGRRRRAIKCESRAAAITRRFDLYHFRSALEKEGMRNEYSQFFAVRMYVRGKMLVLIHADETFK